MRIAAYDPGESTGWAFGTIEDGKLKYIDCGWGACVPVAVDLFKRMRGDDPANPPFDVVVYETWRLRKDKAKEFIGSPIIPIQAVGMTRAAVLFTRPRTPIVGQEPAIKHVIDKQMAGFGFPDYLPERPTSGEEHARDAVRHLWYYCINRKGVRP